MMGRELNWQLCCWNKNFLLEKYFKGVFKRDGWTKTVIMYGH